MFVDKLLAAYPDAKVILTNCNINSWLVSFNNSIYVVLQERLNRFHEVLFPKALGAAFACIRCVVTIWTGGDFENPDKLRQSFLDHYAHVRSVVGKDKLLKFESRDGWEPLCQSLDKDVPTCPYPRRNEAHATVKLVRGVSTAVLATLIAKTTVVAVAIGAVVVGLQRYRPSLSVLIFEKMSLKWTR